MEQPDQESQPTQTQVTTTSKSLNWKKIILTVVIILVVTGLIAGVYWFFVLSKTSGDSDLTGPVPKVTTKTSTESAKESTASAEKDETADWKTYKDTILGFQVKYPEDWFVVSAKSWTEETSYNGGSVTNFYNYDPSTVPGRELAKGEYKITVGKHIKDVNQTLKSFVLSSRSDCCPPKVYDGQPKSTNIASREAYKDTSFIG